MRKPERANPFRFSCISSLAVGSYGAIYSPVCVVSDRHVRIVPDKAYEFLDAADRLPHSVCSAFSASSRIIFLGRPVFSKVLDRIGA